ncbi:MAG: hypothetical protein AVDCRST_MAG32-380, partial [uncultured Nocardioides sp.]
GAAPHQPGRARRRRRGVRGGVRAVPHHGRGLLPPAAGRRRAARHRGSGVGRGRRRDGPRLRDPLPTRVRVAGGRAGRRGRVPDARRAPGRPRPGRRDRPHQAVRGPGARGRGDRHGPVVPLRDGRSPLDLHEAGLHPAAGARLGPGPRGAPHRLRQAAL